MNKPGAHDRFGICKPGGNQCLTLTLGAILMGCGIAAMLYTGMAAIPIQPAIRYDPLIFTASVGIAIAVAFVALIFYDASVADLSSDWYWEQDEELRFTRMSGGVLKKLGWRSRLRQHQRHPAV